MKRTIIVMGLVCVILGGTAAWMRKPTEVVERLPEKSPVQVPSVAVATEPEPIQPADQRRRDAPSDAAAGSHFRFSHHVADRVGYEFGSQEERPPLYSHVLCSDGKIQSMTFTFGWENPGSGAYDFYKVPVASEKFDEVCLSIRKEDASTYRTLVDTPQIQKAKDCTDKEKTAIRFRAGHEKDTLRWCESVGAGERFGFLQAVTQLDKSCEINNWLVDGDKLLPIGFKYNGEYRAEEGSTGPATCVFPLADGDIPERDMIKGGGPMQPSLIFELGQAIYFVHVSPGSEGYTSKLYRLNGDQLEEVVDYYNYVIDHDFWKSTGVPEFLH